MYPLDSPTGSAKKLCILSDMHIMNNMHTENYSPAEGFKDFCEDKVQLLRQEIENLCRNNILNGEEISNKIKKTYKNRYYINSRRD